MMDNDIDFLLADRFIDRIQLNDKDTVPISRKYCSEITFADNSTIRLDNIGNIAAIPSKQEASELIPMFLEQQIIDFLIVLNKL